jgi:hypothetical protein
MFCDYVGMAQTRSVRVRAVAMWLEEHYPTAYAVDVVWKPKLAHDRCDLKDCSQSEIEMGIYGYCVRNGKRFKILLSKRRCRTLSETTETLIHEWAHARTWGLEAQNAHRASCHDDSYWIEYGKMYRHYYEGTGWKAVRKSC